VQFGRIPLPLPATPLENHPGGSEITTRTMRVIRGIVHPTRRKRFPVSCAACARRQNRGTISGWPRQPFFFPRRSEGKTLPRSDYASRSVYRVAPHALNDVAWVTGSCAVRQGVCHRRWIQPSSPSQARPEHMSRKADLGEHAERVVFLEYVIYILPPSFACRRA
jgi:hypothetical protein